MIPEKINRNVMQKKATTYKSYKATMVNNENIVICEMSEHINGTFEKQQNASAANLTP